MKSKALVFAIMMIGLASPAAAQDGQQRAEALSQEAEALAAKRLFDEAAAKLREALVEKSEARYYYRLCLALEQAGKLREARSACRGVRNGDHVTPELIEDSRLAVQRIDLALRGGSPAKPDPAPTPPPPDTVPQPASEPAPAPTAPPPLSAPPPPQRAAESRFNLGVLTGLTVATLAGGDLDATPRVGFAIGGYADLALTRRLIAQAGLMVVSKGANSGTLDTSSVAITYIELPVLMRYVLSRRGRTALALGAAVAIPVAATLEAGAMSIDLLDETTSPDVGVVLGVISELPIGSHALVFDARATIGLRDVSDVRRPGDASTTNVAVYLLVGYRF